MCIKGLLIMILLLAIPSVILFGLGMRWYRSWQEERYNKENGEDK